MARLQTVDPKNASPETKQLLDAVQSALGMIPHMTKVMANSPAVLKGYLDFSGDLSKGKLEGKLREQIALISAQSNACSYCLSAHTAIGKMVGLDDAAISASRHGKGSSEQGTAALTFASQVLDAKGQVTAAQVQAVRDAGFSDGEIAEIIANVALNVLTNYFNVAADVEIDFPQVLVSAA